MKHLMISTTICLVLLLSGCATSSKSYCRHYEFGSNVQNVDPSGGAPSSKPMEGMVAEYPSTIKSIRNLESEEMILSYTPIGKNSVTTTIAAGSISNKFKGAFGNGRVSIVRNQSFITARGDGADIEICFNRGASNSDHPSTPVILPDDIGKNKIPFDAVNIPEAWAYFKERWQTKTPDTTGWPAILVVDDGFFHHPDLRIRPKLFPGFQSTTSEGRISPQPSYGFHGTGVASLINATRNNKSGISGIAGPMLKKDGKLYGGCELIPARAEGGFMGGGFGMAPSNLAKAISYWSRNSHLRVINISQSVVEIAQHDGLYDAFKKAENRGILIVLGAGNDRKVRNMRGSNDWLSTLGNVLIVGGLNNDGSKLWIEDAKKGTSTGKSIDIWAPAENLRVISSTNQLDTVSGTSFATPMVSAVAALILNIKPSYSANKIRDILLKSAKIVTLSDGSKIKRLDAYKALQMAEHP